MNNHAFKCPHCQTHIEVPFGSGLKDDEKGSYEYPTLKDWHEIGPNFPLRLLKLEENDFSVDHQQQGFEAIDAIAKHFEIDAWKRALNNKWNDLFKCYVMMMFYFNKGIPDDPYLISPGQNDESVQYFPKFESRHFVLKDQFDLYADFFFFKAMSVFDGIWQILNIYYDCNLSSNDPRLFGNLLKNLKKSNHGVAATLEELKSDPRYKSAKDLRNSISHRLPVGAQGSGVLRKEYEIRIGTGEYIPSKDIIATAHEFINFCLDAMRQIKEDVNPASVK